MKSILSKQDIIDIFKDIDARLSGKTEIVILGAASLLMLDIRERSTMDIDVANVRNVKEFLKAAKKTGVPVDVVTITTTVDFGNCPTIEVFSGSNLKVHSVTATDLIKLKLERYRKQDPQDIDEIIKKSKLSFDKFYMIASEAMIDFVGNKKILALSIILVAENHYSAEQIAELKNELVIT